MILSDSTLIFILGFLTLSVALNLWLSLRLVRAFRFLTIPPKASLPNLTVGMQISDFPLDRMMDKKKLTLYEYHEYAKVLVFVTSKCPKCKTKLPELRASLEKAKAAGVFIWILSLETKKRMKSFLNDDVLLDATMHTSQAAYDYLNPQGASPYYLFIDAENTLQAEGFIGDENWMSFMEQLKQEE